MIEAVSQKPVAFLSVASSDMLKRLEMATRKSLCHLKLNKKGFQVASGLDIKRFISQFQPLRKKFFIGMNPISGFFYFGRLTRYTAEKKSKNESMTRCFGGAFL
jgi:hypothetical protein